MSRISEHIGIVVDVNDPDKSGRVRVRIELLHDKVPDTDLPWAIPKDQSHGLVEINTPKKGNLVFVNVDDPHEPLYGGNVITKKSIPAFLKVNYPHRKGWQSDSGHKFYRDEISGETLLETPEGVKVRTDKQGNHSIEAPKQQKITVNGTVVTTSNANLRVSSPAIVSEGNAVIDSGANGSFTTPLGQVVTVRHGIITDIS